MKANELRIGNWVKGASREAPQQVTAKMFSHFEKLNLQPIELTPEILKKADFKIQIENVANTYRKIIGFNKFFDVVNYKSVFGYHTSTFKYLHQLQNIYFAMTGKELVFKEPITPHTGQSNAV